jgi:hypothetical protein
MWKFNTTSNQFEPAASFTGHTGPVITLLFVGNRLYSGSMDNTIRVRMLFISFKTPCSLLDVLLFENVKYEMHSFRDVDCIMKEKERCLCCFLVLAGLGACNSPVHTNSRGPHQRCDGPSLLGAIPDLMQFGWNH